MLMIDDVLYKFNGGIIFNKMELKLAFHQNELDKSLRPITIFCLSKGLFRYKRLMFGMSCVPKLYQHIIQNK